jgi:hypothetical protein
MSLGMSFGPRIRQEQSLESKVEHRLSLAQLYFGNFVSTPNGICPKCNHVLSTDEILKGFSASPTDFNTSCPKCGEKFLSHLIITDKETGKEKETMSVTFLCSAQTLHKMKIAKAKRGKIGIAYLSKYDRPLFYNMVRHWGTYEKAMDVLKKNS